MPQAGRRLWLVLIVSGVFGAAGLGLSLAFAGAASALEVPTVSTPTLPVPTPTVTAPVPTPTVPAPTPTVPAPTPTVPVPTPTVPVPTPTVPVPTPTVPAPTPTLPAPTPTLPVPTPTVPTPSPSPGLPAPAPSLPGGPSAPSGPVAGPSGSVAGAPLLGGGGGGAAGGGLGGGGGSGAGAGVGSSGGGAGGPASTGFAAVPAGTAAPITRSQSTTSGVAVTNVRGRPGVVRVTFRLARGGRVVVTLRGPLPSCDRVARLVIQGRRGRNAVAFNGQLGSRTLAEGAYLLGFRPLHARTTRWVAVAVGQSGASALPRSTTRSALNQCSAANASTSVFAVSFLAGGVSLPDGREAAWSGQGENSASDGGQRVGTVEQPERSGVLGAGAQHLDEAVDYLNPIFGYAILTIMIASLFAIAYLVVSYLRHDGIGRPRL